MKKTNQTEKEKLAEIKATSQIKIETMYVVADFAKLHGIKEYEDNIASN